MSQQQIRPYSTSDNDAVLSLINADRLPGQPVATPAMLVDALAGRSGVDAAWWEEIDQLRTDVLDDSRGTVAGVVSYARRSRDRTGVLLWMHCHEDGAIATRLINHALSRLDGYPTVEAFGFATALGHGLEALPVRHRPATDTALRTAGFIATDLWRYMRRSLPASEIPSADGVTLTEPDDESRTLAIHEHGELLAEATVGLPFHGVAVLWWINVEPACRRRGTGRALLGAALTTLTELGAEQVILFVDDDEPDSDRDRTAANQLYDSVGFQEIDRLCSYQLSRT